MAKRKISSISLEGAKCIEVEEAPSSVDKVIDHTNTGDKVIERVDEGGKVIDAASDKGSKSRKKSPPKKQTCSSSTAPKISEIAQGLQSTNRGQETSTTSFKSIYCPNCGKKYYKPNSRYCTQCGQQRK